MNEAGIFLAILLALIIFAVLALLVYGAFFHRLNLSGSSAFDPIRRGSIRVGIVKPDALQIEKADMRQTASNLWSNPLSVFSWTRTSSTQPRKKSTKTRTPSTKSKKRLTSFFSN